MRRSETAQMFAWAVSCREKGVLGEKGSLFRICLVSSTKVFGEKPFGSSIKLEPILWFGETVSLVGEEHVFIVDAFALHGLDNLLRLCLLDTRVISSLRNQHWYLDLIYFE